MIAASPQGLNALAAALYAAAAAAAFLRSRGRAATALAASAAAIHAAGLALAWREAGHGPFLTASEVLSANAWLLAAATVALSLRDLRLASLGRATFASCAAMTAGAAAAGFRAVPLPVVMRSVWLDLHASAFGLAFVALALATAAAVLGVRGGDLARVDGRRWAGVGLAFWTVGMLLGSVWGYDSTGRFWAWEPVEIWALVVWLVLGMHLHVLRFYDPGARVRAWLQVGAFSLAAFTLFVVPRIGLTHGGLMGQ